MHILYANNYVWYARLKMEASTSRPQLVTRPFGDRLYKGCIIKNATLNILKYSLCFQAQ